MRKISHTHELLSGDKGTQKQFVLMCLPRMTVDNSWPWQIFWSGETHLYLNGVAKTRNCRILAVENSLVYQEISLHESIVTVWCGFTSSLTIELYLFEENCALGSLTCSVNGVRYSALLQNFLILSLQQRNCLETTIFIQSGIFDSSSGNPN